MDVAKVIGVMMTNPGNIRDYSGMSKIGKPGVPVIAIPTTSGTGSELTIWSVLSEKEKKQKFGVGSVLNCARIALLDPELTISLPPAITAATGMDALTHALESYVSTATQPISEAMSEQSMALIARSLRLAVAQPRGRRASDRKTPLPDDGIGLRRRLPGKDEAVVELLLEHVLVGLPRVLRFGEVLGAALDLDRKSVV